MPSADLASLKRSSLIIIETQEQTYFMSLANFFFNNIFERQNPLCFPIFYLQFEQVLIWLLFNLW